MEKKQKTILIIDDDIFLLNMYSLKFRESGFDVCAETSSEHALVLLKKSSPDIILMDLMMPLIDGFETLKQIHEQKLAPNACIIVLSNLGEQKDRERARALGIHGYIVKASMVPSEVVAQVIKIMKNKQENQ